MDHRQIQDYNYKLDCDWRHDILRYVRKLLDKDQHNVCLRMTYL